MLEKRRKSIFVTVVEYDPDDPEEYAYWQSRYGNFAILQGNGGVNMGISLIKVIREVTGASLVGAKNIAHAFIKGINAEMKNANKNWELQVWVNNLTDDQLRTVSDLIAKKFL